MIKNRVDELINATNKLLLAGSAVSREWGSMSKDLAVKGVVFDLPVDGESFREIAGPLDTRRTLGDTNILHSKVGPAVEGPSGKMWFQYGVLHRRHLPAVVRDGVSAWFSEGLAHRDNGPAIIIDDNGKTISIWMRNGVIHNDAGPAIITDDGTEVYVKNGLLHRDDGPAISGAADLEVWYRDGEIHREDGPAVIDGDTKTHFRRGRIGFTKQTLKDAESPYPIIDRDESSYCIVDENGDKCWYLNGTQTRHRVGAPAFQGKSAVAYYNHGKLHRDDGPALVSSDGIHYWYKDGLLHREGQPAIVAPDGENACFMNGRLTSFDGSPGISMLDEDLGNNFVWINPSTGKVADSANGNPSISWGTGKQLSKASLLLMKYAPDLRKKVNVEEHYINGKKYGEVNRYHNLPYRDLRYTLGDGFLVFSGTTSMVHGSLSPQMSDMTFFGGDSVIISNRDLEFSNCQFNGCTISMEFSDDANVHFKGCSFINGARVDYKPKPEVKDTSTDISDLSDESFPPSKCTDISEDAQKSSIEIEDSSFLKNLASIMIDAGLNSLISSARNSAVTTEVQEDCYAPV